MRRWLKVLCSVGVAAMLMIGPSACGRKGAGNGSESAGSNSGQLKPEPAAGKATDAEASTRPGGSTGGRPAVGSLGARERKLQSTWLVPTGRFPPIPEIWDVKGRTVSRVDRFGNKTTGAFVVLSPCRLEVAGKVFQYLLDGKGLRVTDGAVLVSEGGNLVACFDSATYVYRAGKCTRYAGLVHTGRGKPATCRVQGRGANVRFSVKQAGPGKRAARRLYARGLGITRTAAARWHRHPPGAPARRAANLTTALATVAQQNERYIVPYGFWFGMTKKEVHKVVKSGFFGRSTCGVGGGRLWDAVPLPYLGLPVAAAGCDFKRGRLSGVYLRLRMLEDRAAGKKLFERTARQLVGLLRTAPRKSGKSNQQTLRWTVGGVQITVDLERGPSADARREPETKISLQLTATPSYRAPAAGQRWLHPARRARFQPWWKRKKLPPYRPGGLQLGQPKAQVVATLRRRGVRLLPSIGPSSRANIMWHGLGQNETAYLCQLGLLPGSRGRTWCVFDGGKLSYITALYGGDYHNYRQRVLWRQVYETMLAQLGTKPVPSYGGFKSPEGWTQRIWRFQGGIVIARDGEESNGAYVYNYVALAVIPQVTITPGKARAPKPGAARR